VAAGFQREHLAWGALDTTFLCHEMKKRLRAGALQISAVLHPNGTVGEIARVTRSYLLPLILDGREYGSF
jgi:hypothetical protein